MERLLSVKEAAKILGVCGKTVRNYIDQGEIKPVKLSRRNLRIRESSLKKFINRKEKSSL